MLELKGVAAGYGSRPVLEDITLDIRPGEVLAVIGPNGGGKSTLLRAAAGLLPVTAGRVLLDGEDLAAMRPRDIARRASYLPQSRDVPDITAGSLVLHGRFPRMSYPRRVRPLDREIAAAALQAVDGADLARRPMRELSGGQRQKVYIAMALAQETDTVLMDEPTTYLDIAHQLQVTALARSLAARGKAVVLVMHDLPLALQGADRAAVLCGGRLAALGAPEEIFTSGVIPRVFGVTLARAETENGPRYYCGGEVR